MLFLSIRAERLTFIKDDKGEVLTVIDEEPGNFDYEGKKLKSK